jgi:hypothetical protein
MTTFKRTKWLLVLAFAITLLCDWVAVAQQGRSPRQIVDELSSTYCSKWAWLKESPKMFPPKSAAHAQLKEQEFHMKKIDIMTIPKQVEQLEKELKEANIQATDFPTALSDLASAMRTALVLLEPDYSLPNTKYLVGPMAKEYKLEKGTRYYTVQIRGMENKVMNWAEYSKYVDESVQVIRKWGHCDLGERDDN